MASLPAFTSQKFRFWSFVSMVLLVFVHGYNLELRYLQPWTLPMERLSVTSFTEYFFANGIFRFRIPMLFIISGYLYALHDDQHTNKQRVKKRLRSLLLPYFIWSAFGLLLTFVLEFFPPTRQMVAASNVVQIDETRHLIHDYHWYEVLARWIFFPVAYQLWFIRVLFIYNLFYPFIRYCIRHPIVKWIFFSIAFLLWLGTFGTPLMEGEGLLFFSLGIWMQKNSFNIDTPNKWLQPARWVWPFVVLCIMKSWLAFRGLDLVGNAVFPVLAFLHKIIVFSGLVTAWYGCNKLTSFFMQKQWFVRLSGFSFIIYAMHAPFVAFGIDTALSWFRPLYGYRLLTFLVWPTIIIAACILIGIVLRKLLPHFYSLLTGGRGL